MQLGNFLLDEVFPKVYWLIDTQGKLGSVLRWRKKIVMERSDGSELTTMDLPARHHNMTQLTNKAGIGVTKERNEPEKAETGEELIDIPVVHISTSGLSTNACQPQSGRDCSNMIINHFTTL